MKRFMLMLIATGFLVGIALLAHAQDVTNDVPKKPSVDEFMAKLIKLGPGIYNVKKNKRGRIVSCVAIGQARISTALGKGKGLEIARQKADMDASAQFVKWLKEEVTLQLSTDEETVILLEGTEGNGENDTLTESGKSIEKNSRRMESLSKGLVRGMQIIYKNVDGDGRTYTLIKGWKADNAEGVKHLRADLASDQPRSKEAKKKERSSRPAQDKQIDSESVATDDATDYL